MPTLMRCKDCSKRYYTSSSIPENEEVGKCDKCGGVVISLGPPKPDKDNSEE